MRYGEYHAEAVRPSPANDRLEPPAPDTRRESIERRILESLVELIGRGAAWHQIGIRQIAEGAAISRTAFYDFFGSKNEVLGHLVRGIHDELARLLSEPGSSEAEVGVDLTQLRELLVLLADYADVHGPVYRAFLDATADDPHLDGLWDDLMEIHIRLGIAAIDRVRRTFPNAPRTPDSRSLAEVLVVMTERTVLFLLRQPVDAHRRPELLEALAQVWERSVFGGPIPTDR